MEFWKMNGAGNDFIIVKDWEKTKTPKEWSRLASVLCDPHRSLGADGLMVVTAPTGDADLRMLFLNRDGSLGELCGNGARCICRYAYECGLAGDTQTVETTAGIITGERIDNGRYRIRLPAITLLRPVMLETELGIFTGTYAEMGSPALPHGIFPQPESDTFTLAKLLRHHPLFPKGANITFYRLLSPHKVEAVTFERGVEDFTLSCGSGAGCLTATLHECGITEEKTLVIVMPGGVLETELSSSKEIFLTGPAVLVAHGTIFLQELQSYLPKIFHFEP